MGPLVIRPVTDVTRGILAAQASDLRVRNYARVLAFAPERERIPGLLDRARFDYNLAEAHFGLGDLVEATEALNRADHSFREWERADVEAHADLPPEEHFMRDDGLNASHVVWLAMRIRWFAPRLQGEWIKQARRASGAGRRLIDPVIARLDGLREEYAEVWRKSRRVGQLKSPA